MTPSDDVLLWPGSDGELFTPPCSCAYLPEQISSLQVRILDQLEREQYDEWLRRGWRRHGIHFFRPGCPHCVRCQSLRVDPVAFRPSKSQRRVWRKNTDVRVEIARPTVTSTHMQLFEAYHQDMHLRRGWRHESIDLVDYRNGFLRGRFDFAWEFRYFRAGSLVGIGLVDVTARSSSSVYFYHDPQWRPAGPGTFSLLCELEFARQRNLRHHYLGYWIAECPSMEYKARFRPHQLLQAYVDDDAQPIWLDAE